MSVFERIYIKDKQWYDIISKNIHSLTHNKGREKISIESTINEMLYKANEQHLTVYPDFKNILKVFELPLGEIKVVILGQDPYHGENQAHGLAFSVQEGIKIPPSLMNIFKEVNRDISCGIPDDGYLERWFKQGVFLLNSILTVEKNKPLSHKGIGWEVFTNFIISIISKKRENVVFLLWGNSARDKKKIIDEKKHLVLESSHPSPLSVYRGFWGCSHFSQTNEYLRTKGYSEIKWCEKNKNIKK